MVTIHIICVHNLKFSFLHTVYVHNFFSSEQATNTFLN